MRRLIRRPSPGTVIALTALFVALGGSAYATHTQRLARDAVHSFNIRNDAVTTADIQGGGGRPGTIKNRDVHPLLAVAKGFATVAGRSSNGAATVLNYGGQQTRTNPAGASAQRVAPGVYDVTFAANTGTGRFINVDSVNDLAVQVTPRLSVGQGASFGTLSTLGSSAGPNQVVLRIVLRNAQNQPVDRTFTVQFYARTVS